MAVQIALAVGLFIVICGPPGLTATQVVPDGLVSTEVKKTLVRGVKGVLTCRFHGDPLAVYWRKGIDPDDLSPMAVWSDGEVYGPRYDDGSYDVDENYSLIIQNVSTADVGRMHCTVSNNKGPPITNYTDILVVDTAITTTPRITLHMRQATYGILQCTVHIKAREVSWKKGTTSSANESLVVIENGRGVAERSGAGYDDGTYNITQNYSLVIKELQVHHEGLYVCEVTDDTGISFRNQTFVNVVAHPLEPFPTIRECLNTEQHDSSYCILVAKFRMTLTCEAVKYYPSVKLVFLYGSRAIEQSDTREWNNTDGTKNKTITIAPIGNKELYTCVASSMPGTNANKTISVLLQGDDPVKSTLVIIFVLLSALILISLVAYFIWRKKHPVPPVSYSSVARRDPYQEGEDFIVKDLTKMEMQAFELRVDRVLMKHYRSIHDDYYAVRLQAEEIIYENRTALFDTHQMLTDWRQRPTSTSSQYGRAYRQTDIVADKTGPDSVYPWPTDEELKSLSRHLTPKSMNEICKELQITYRHDDAKDEGKRFDSLCEWRTKLSDKSLEEKHEQLSLVLESNNLAGLLPTLKRPYIYKSELVDFAFHLLMLDLFPIAKELGINATKLVSYRPAFHPSHLKLGTIKLLTELGSDSIYVIFSIIERHCRKVIPVGQFEYDMSYGELSSISEAINQSAGRRADQATSDMLTEELGILQDVLQLTDQDKADRLDTSQPITAFALFKIWKEKPRPSIFHYRAALANELRINGKSGLADEIIAGKYITEQTSLAFIDNMVRGLNQDQLRRLGKILQLSGDKEPWHTTTPLNEISKQIYDLVTYWTKSLIAQEYRDLNDKLVEHGFLDLAREITFIETK